MRSEGQSTVRWQDVFAIVKEALKYARNSNYRNTFLVINRAFFLRLPLHGDIGFFCKLGSL